MKVFGGTFGEAEAAHLLRRAAFAPRPGEARRLASLGLVQAVERILGPEAEGSCPEADAVEKMLPDSAGADELGACWLLRLGTSSAPLREKLALFFHNHFVSSISKVHSARMMLGEIQLFRRAGLGSFGALLQAVSRHPAMVRYLDLEASRLGAPNENFARELMELFTMGAGHFTEHDVKEAARAFTGFGLRSGRFHFVAAAHDGGMKSILGETGPWSGDQVVELCVGRPATNLLLGRKLAQAFLCDEPPGEAVELLARSLRAHAGVLRLFLKQLFCSEMFYEPRFRHALTRSPAELAAAAMRLLLVRPSFLSLARKLRQMGQALFDPPTVKGYEGGRAWLNPASWLARRSFLLEMAAEVQVDELLSKLPPSGGNTTPLESLARHILGEELPARDGRLLRRLADEKKAGAAERLLVLLLAHPRFQRS